VSQIWTYAARRGAFEALAGAAFAATRLEAEEVEDLEPIDLRSAEPERLALFEEGGPSSVLPNINAANFAVFSSKDSDTLAASLESLRNSCCTFLKLASGVLSRGTNSRPLLPAPSAMGTGFGGSPRLQGI